VSDISKCKNETCPLKESCWRYTAPASSFWQSYGHFQYEITEDGKEVTCVYYWNNKGFKHEKTSSRI
jgi:hypothetical protein